MTSTKQPSRILHVMLVALWVALLAPHQSAAQDTIVLPANGYGDTTGSSFIVYDDGGPNGPHSSSTNVTYTFRTSTPGAKWRVLVHNSITSTSPYISRLRIFRGDSSIVNASYSSSYLYFSSTSSSCRGGHYTGSEYMYNYLFYCPDSVITIVFSCDDDNPTKGFEIELCEVGCYDDRATNITTKMLDTSADMSEGTLRLKWTENNTSTHWMIVYYIHQNTQYSSYIGSEWGGALTHDTINFDTLYSDTNYIDIPHYEYGKSLVYSIQPVCNYLCGGYLRMGSQIFVITISQQCSCIYPRGLTSELIGDSLYVHWRQDTSAVYWSVYSSYFNNTVIDSMMTDTSITLYWPDSLRCIYKYVYVSGNCYSGHSNCGRDGTSQVRYNCSSISSFGVYDNAENYVTSQSMALLSQSAHSLVVGWSEADTTTPYEVICRKAIFPYDTITIDTVGPHVTWDTITGLEETTHYNIIVQVLCTDGYRSCYKTSKTFATSLDNCIDYINLTDSANVHLTRGTYNNPAEYDETSYYLHYYPLYSQNYYRDWSFSLYFFNNDGRHTIITDTLARDSHTGNQLRQVPPGMKASMKLGDDNVGAQAETITYDYFVDSTVHDLLMLKYALVMQNPNHTMVNQPHFTMEILDDAGHLIDSNCSYVDFYAADNLTGWNSVTGTNIIWKDWTTIGLDIAPYHGQKIKIRFTNKDCAEGGHYAYAYFTIHCDNKRICLYNFCDAIDSIHMRVPQGFEYSWTRNNEPVVLGTDYEIIAPVDSTTVYKCRCNLVGKPDCYFTMESYAIGVFPKAQLHGWVDTCKQIAYIVNESFVYADTTYDICIPQFIDNSYWLLDDGSTVADDTLRLPLNENRTYKVDLIAHLSESWCRDSMATSYIVTFAYDKRILGDSSICYGDSLQLTAHIAPYDGIQLRWLATGSTDSVSHWMPLTDSTIAVEMKYSNCRDTLFHPVRVHPHYNDTIRATICDHDSYSLNGFNNNLPGTYTQHLTSTYNCDSLSTLSLSVNYSRHASDTLVACDSTVWQRHSFVANTDTVVTYSDRNGCDSTHALHLTILHSFFHADTARLCVGDTWSGETLTTTGTRTLTERFSTAEGCDSTLATVLVVSNHSADTIKAVLCDGEALSLLGRDYHAAGTYYDTTVNNAGCDSVIRLDLRVATSTSQTFDAVSCDGTPMLFFGHDYATAGTYVDTVANAAGCDSIVTLHLAARTSSDTAFTVAICWAESYNFNGDSLFQFGDYVDTLVNAAGCDSVVYLSLVVIPTYSATNYRNTYYGDTVVWEGLTLTEPGSYTVVYTDTNGCDSTLTLVLSMHLAADDIGEDYTIAVYPNPTYGMLTVEASGIAGDAELRLLDPLGRTMQRESATLDTPHILDITAQSRGHYLLQVVTPQGSTTFRIIKM